MNPSDMASELKGQTKQALEKAGDQISDHASQLRDVVDEARYVSEDFIQTHPWLAVSVAAGIGFAFGLMIARR